MIKTVTRHLFAALPYALLLFGPAWLVPKIPDLPGAMQGFIDDLPFWLGALCIVLAFSFHRSRILLAALSVALGYWAIGLTPSLTANQAIALFALVQSALLLNFALIAYVDERGLLTRFGVVRLGFILLESAVIAGLVSLDSQLLADFMHWRPLGDTFLDRIYIPQILIFLLVLPVVVLVTVRVFMQPSAIHSALLAACITIIILSFRPEQEYWITIYMTTAIIILLFGLTHDSYRMAFRDELTGLPGRRALQHKLLSLGGVYSIAMIDVDHFKQFNDTYGHEVGDQVLKMVASQLSQVTGGGTAYRYGGEEFTIVFPRKSARQCIPHLSEIRKRIELYGLRLRHKQQRPRRKEVGEKRRGTGGLTQRVGVTVSIGLAEASERLSTTKQVIEAADKALYRAKQQGRNRISR